MFANKKNGKLSTFVKESNQVPVRNQNIKYEGTITCS
jgi:hypothetical protein